MTHFHRLLLLAVLLLCACQSKPPTLSSNYVPPVVPETTTAPAVTLAGPAISTTQHSTGAQHGRVIFLTDCTACHEAQPIDDFSLEDWNTRILPKMTANADLKPDQIADLKAYIAYAHARTSTPSSTPTSP